MFRVFWFFVCLVFLGSSYAYAEHLEDSRPVAITIAYENIHNPPRALGEGTAIDWQKPGLTLELLQQVSQLTGIEFKYKRMPWKRGMYLLQHNEIDGIFHASYKPDREKISVYPMKSGKPDPSKAIFQQSYSLYVKDDSKAIIENGKIHNIDGDIGVIRGYSITNELEKNGFSIENISSVQEAFAKLAKGRIAAFAMLENIADDYLKRNYHKFNHIVKIQPSLKSKDYYLIFSKEFGINHAQLVDEIWQQIEHVNHSEEYLNAVSRY